MNGSPDPAPADEPITPDLLADLQAGLLDDAAAARLRHRVRRSTRATIEELTQAPDIGLSDTQLLSLLSQQPELGAFDDPRRRADCLSNLGYPPGVKVLGGRSLEVNGRPGVLILLPDGAPGSIVGLVVTTDCTAEDAGLLAHTVVKRP